MGQSSTRTSSAALLTRDARVGSSRDMRSHLETDTMGSKFRTCIGCAKRDDPAALVRLVLVPSASPSGPATVVPDAKGGAFGRGAHVHATARCIENAASRGLSRAFRREMRVEPGALSGAIVGAYERRLDGLLSGGVRGGHVRIGAEGVSEAYRAGKVALALLACDARAAAARAEVRALTSEGKVLVCGTKVQLARALGRADAMERDDSASAEAGVGVCAVTNPLLAAAIRRAWLCVVGPTSGTSPRDAAGIDNAEAK